MLQSLMGPARCRTAACVTFISYIISRACYTFLQVKAVGKDRLVLDLSCKKHNGAYHVATDRWQKISSLAVNEQSLGKLGKSCGEFLVHGVDVEGKQSGIDEELVKLLAEQSPVPVTYAGGVSSMVSLSSAKLCKRVMLRSQKAVWLLQHAQLCCLAVLKTLQTCQSMRSRLFSCACCAKVFVLAMHH